MLYTTRIGNRTGLNTRVNYFQISIYKSSPGVVLYAKYEASSCDIDNLKTVDVVNLFSYEMELLASERARHSQVCSIENHDICLYYSTTVFARSVAAATNVSTCAEGGHYSRAAFIYLTVLSPKN